MPRVKHVRANKDYPDAGIKKGEMYYTWGLKTGPRSSRKFRQKTPPKPSQLTSSEFRRTLYGIEEELAGLESVDDLDSVISSIEELRDETQEKLDNMPEGLQQGSTGELLQERIDGLESWISELEGLKDEVPDEKEEDETEEAFNERKEEALQALKESSAGL